MFDFIDDVLVFLLLTLNIFYTFAGIVYDIGLVSPSYFTNIYLVDAGERVVFYFYFQLQVPRNSHKMKQLTKNT